MHIINGCIFISRKASNIWDSDSAPRMLECSYKSPEVEEQRFDDELAIQDSIFVLQ